MARYAAFLRGINLGNRRVTGADLCAPFADLGFTDVASFLASGNVAFTADDPADADEDTIASALEEALGFPVDTFLRTGEELGEIVERDPFPAEAHERSTGKPQVLLLHREPADHAATAALAHATDEDRLALVGRELHWLPSGGISQSALDLAELGRLIGPVTVRTANTLARMHRKLFAAGGSGGTPVTSRS